MTDNYAAFDKRTRRELDVPAEMWIRQVTPTTLELRTVGSAAVIASAVAEPGGWAVRLPDEVVFTGGAETARRLLWEAAAAAPTRPTTTPRARPRVPWDHLNRVD